MNRREEALELGVQPLRERHEGLDALVVGRREPAPDVEEPEFEPARLRLAKDVRGYLEGLDVVLEIRALAPDVEAEPLYAEPRRLRGRDEVDRVARLAAELAREFHHRAGVRDHETEHEPRVGRVFPYLPDLLSVVVGD